MFLNNKDELSRAVNRIRDEPTITYKNIKNMSESSITQIIMGVVYHYGWDVFNPNEVEPQFNKLIKGRPDIVLKKSMQLKVLIEIKRANVNLKEKGENQLMGYLMDRDEVKLGVLTNAVSWIFYKRNQDNGRPLEVANVNIKKHPDAHIEQIFAKYLSKESY